ncbi:LysR family transcriptional regulator [Leucobacter coleopterorum]|uniref:LysR family transcriptional regulator n=1 Tax=Leucobacter coleopterorum TaxID=2714933 RepID=A0ABX6JVA4_9MICO|nr:LysR family transcriptional regulator [Leucobacter coleopterorum]QIM18223.1 LysR family transcriptional regulator [Leucobacter coleopterorum]
MIDHRLTTLRTFASCGTIAATAELTGFSPSAVSAQLREFQRSLGMTLLVKDGRNLRLTATGRDLVNRSDAVVVEWERTRAAALSAGQQTQRRFGIGGFSTAAANLLAPLAANLRVMRPEVQVGVIEADPERCLKLLTAERLDLAVIVAAQADPTPGESAFERIELLTDPLDVMMPSAHPLAQRESVTLEELAGEDWITDAEGGPYQALFVAAFASVGLSPRVLHEAIEWETAMALVGAGLGLGLLPRLVSVDRVPNVARVRLAGSVRSSRRILAVVRRGSAESPLVAESLETLRDIAKAIMHERLLSEI